jgi:hypothetical protein
MSTRISKLHVHNLRHYWHRCGIDNATIENCLNEAIVGGGVNNAVLTVAKGIYAAWYV